MVMGYVNHRLYVSALVSPASDVLIEGAGACISLFVFLIHSDHGSVYMFCLMYANMTFLYVLICGVDL